ncbi:MAG TPA: response regulator [Lachnospiraceae bacterium]|jgi:two-component system, chemotaxis family, chemotaxis protein CheY|nr:response regulator [Lachnospiraceae bacterium]
MSNNNVKVLLCDDSILARKSLKEILLQLGYDDIVEVADGQTVIDTYKVLKPTIVFLDIVMPVKDGITAVKEIIAADPEACIVMVSSVGTQTHLKEAIKAGAKDFIQKPVDIEQLKHILHHCIGG